MSTLLTLVVIAIALYFLLKYYYRLPDISSRTISHVINDGYETTLGKSVIPGLEKNPGRTGVHLLPDGLDAIVARLVGASQAEKSIDLQYYRYYHDTVGTLLVYELLKAADRGVRIRMLIDDLYGSDNEDLWLGLDAHPNIEFRLWNPWKRNRNWMIQGALRFRTVNYRMHSKSFTIDNVATILGGRNIGNEYFDADPDVAFSDIDVLAVGFAAQDVSMAFDQYWNSEHAYPANILIRQGTSEDLDNLKSSTEEFVKNNTDSPYVKALQNSTLANDIRSGTVDFSWASEARVIHDSSEKVRTGRAGKDGLLITHLAPYMTGVKKTLDISSPYFVPGFDFKSRLCKLGKEGVKVRILTNSLASNDVTAVHAGYAKYRRPLLRCGVELYEFDEALLKAEGKKFTWLPGLKKSSLHAKTMVFDGETMFVGSFNFDARSLYINNEIGLLFRSPEIAGKAAKNFEENVGKMAFKVEFNRPGGNENLKWVGGQGGPNAVLQKEPYATTTQKLMVGVLKWVPMDPQL